MQVTARRQPRRRRADHLRVQRAVQRRLSRDPAPPRRVDRRRPGQRGRPRLPSRAAAPSSAAPTRPAPSAPRSSATARRIVWHYQASDELRTFDVHYRLSGVAVAYDDVVDVNLKVWGSEWKEPLGRLTATEIAPGQDPPRLGPPRLRARRRPARRDEGRPSRAERARRTVRRAPHGDPALGVHLDRGDARRLRRTAWRRSSPQETADAAAFDRDKQRIDHAKQHPWRYALFLLLLGTIPAFLVVAGVFWFFGREVQTGYDREYEQEPPTETQPALVPTLLRQGGEAGSFEFTATLFDLIRRGVFTSTPVTTERAIWGGLRSESVSDLELAAGKADEPLTAWERAVADVVDGVDRGRPRAAVALPRADRGRPDDDEHALHVVQGERRHRDRQPEVVHLARRGAARAVAAPLRRDRGAALLPRRQRLALRVPALERRRAARPRALQRS